MERQLPFLTALLVIGATTGLNAQQRYLDEIFTNDQIEITEDVIYGTNIDFWTSDFDSPDVGENVVELQTAVTMGTEIPAAYFDLNNTSTAVKVTNLRMDVYRPGASDQVTDRPLVIYLHTGNALPPPINGSPNGTRKDSSAVENCMRLARRGYVAASMSYRLGWNPGLLSEEERRGSLLNAIYRAIHDVRQNIRFMKESASSTNEFGISADRIIVMGEGTGGYIALANATLDDPAELFIEKFRPDPFDATVSYIDTTVVGDLQGFNGQLALYRPNGQDHSSHFCVNMGGALADISWLEQGDVPMVAFHSIFDPFAPFTEGIVIVPTTGGPVVPVHGSNFFMEVVNEYGNNDAFVELPDGDPFTDRPRSLYGTAHVHGSNTVTINQNVEGLFPFVTPDWPAQQEGLNEEASPWQWWDPNSAAATAIVVEPNITAHMAASASNPNMSPEKGRAYIDTIQGYLNPRIVCALQLGPCSLVGIDENSSISLGVDVYPNPAHDQITINSSAAKINSYLIYDQQGRLVSRGRVDAPTVIVDRNDLKAGSYVVELLFDQGRVIRKLILD